MENKIEFEDKKVKRLIETTLLGLLYTAITRIKEIGLENAEADLNKIFELSNGLIQYWEIDGLDEFKCIVSFTEIY